MNESLKQEQYEESNSIMYDPDTDGYDPDTDAGMEAAYQREQRKLYAGEAKHTCPDCGTPNALTDEQVRRGYHCDRCTRATEQGW